VDLHAAQMRLYRALHEIAVAVGGVFDTAELARIVATELHKQAAHAAGGGGHQHTVARTQSGCPNQGEGGAPIGKKGNRLARFEAVRNPDGIGGVDHNVVCIAAKAAGRTDDALAEQRRVDPFAYGDDRAGHAIAKHHG
jgi:hypothetical protein